MSTKRDYEEHGDPTGFGMGGRPVFDTDKVVDWRCPNCGSDGFHKAGVARYYVICTGECPVKLFTVFREASCSGGDRDGQ